MALAASFFFTDVGTNEDNLPPKDSVSFSGDFKSEDVGIGNATRAILLSALSRNFDNAMKLCMTGSEKWEDQFAAGRKSR
jgi:hypothetical protein